MGDRTQMTKDVKPEERDEERDEDDEKLPKDLRSPTVQKTGDVKEKKD